MILTELAKKQLDVFRAYEAESRSRPSRAELAELFGTTERTIQRNNARLRERGLMPDVMQINAGRASSRARSTGERPPVSLSPLSPVSRLPFSCPETAPRPRGEETPDLKVFLEIVNKALSLSLSLLERLGDKETRERDRGGETTETTKREATVASESLASIRSELEDASRGVANIVAIHEPRTPSIVVDRRSDPASFGNEHKSASVCVAPDLVTFALRSACERLGGATFTGDDRHRAEQCLVTQTDDSLTRDRVRVAIDGAVKDGAKSVRFVFNPAFFPGRLGSTMRAVESRTDECKMTLHRLKQALRGERSAVDAVAQAREVLRRGGVSDETLVRRIEDLIAAVEELDKGEVVAGSPGIHRANDGAPIARHGHRDHPFRGIVIT